MPSQVESGFCCHIGEGAVAVVAIQGVGLDHGLAVAVTLAGYLHGHAYDAVYDVDIQPTVVVEVDELGGPAN